MYEAKCIHAYSEFVLPTSLLIWLSSGCVLPVSSARLNHPNRQQSSVVAMHMSVHMSAAVHMKVLLSLQGQAYVLYNYSVAMHMQGHLDMSSPQLCSTVYYLRSLHSSNCDKAIRVKFTELLLTWQMVC